MYKFAGNHQLHRIWISVLGYVKLNDCYRPMGLSTSRALHVDPRRNVKLKKRMSRHNVFVYGTLKRGEPNHSWLNNTSKGSSEFIGAAVTVQKYPLVIASKYNIPFLLDAPGVGYNVTGEVYRVNEGMLHHLDTLEDHPNFYVRELQQVQLRNAILDVQGPESSNLTCWIYLLKNFKPSLLHQELFENYSSTGPHGLQYAARYQRDPSYSAKDDVKAA